MTISEFSMDLFSLKGKNAIVTGGGTGLGQSFSLALAKAGADVCMPGLEQADAGFLAMIEAEGVRALSLETDLTEPEAPEQAVAFCMEELGSIDILVNCAGISLNREFSAYSRKEWDPMVAINLTAAFEMSHRAALRMIEQECGKIINVCSLYTFLGGSGSAAYAATKHGIAGLTRALCDELARYNIQVNGIAPGYFITRVTEETRNDPERNGWVVAHTPVGRWGEAADLMGAIVFLASRASQFVNGHILAVDGGYLVR